jgi:hypothetical protein
MFPLPSFLIDKVFTEAQAAKFSQAVALLTETGDITYSSDEYPQKSSRGCDCLGTSAKFSSQTGDL